MSNPKVSEPFGGIWNLYPAQHLKVASWRTLSLDHSLTFVVTVKMSGRVVEPLDIFKILRASFQASFRSDQLSTASRVNTFSQQL